MNRIKAIHTTLALGRCIAPGLIAAVFAFAPASARAQNRSAYVTVLDTDAEIDEPRLDERPYVDRRYIFRRTAPGQTATVIEERTVTEPPPTVVEERIVQEDIEIDPPEVVTEPEPVIDPDPVIENQVIVPEPIIENEVIVEPRNETNEEPPHFTYRHDETHVEPVVPYRRNGVDVNVGAGRHGVGVDVMVDVPPKATTIYREPPVVYREYREGPVVYPNGRHRYVERHVHRYPVQIYRNGRWYYEDDRDRFVEHRHEHDDEYYEKRREAEKDLREDLRDADDEEDVREAWDDYYEELADIEDDD
jgi:hypothetical protein